VLVSNIVMGCRNQENRGGMYKCISKIALFTAALFLVVSCKPSDRFIVNSRELLKRSSQSSETINDSLLLVVQNKLPYMQDIESTVIDFKKIHPSSAQLVYLAKEKVSGPLMHHLLIDEDLLQRVTSNYPGAFLISLKGDKIIRAYAFPPEFADFHLQALWLGLNQEFNQAPDLVSIFHEFYSRFNLDTITIDGINNGEVLVINNPNIRCVDYSLFWLIKHGSDERKLVLMPEFLEASMQLYNNYQLSNSILELNSDLETSIEIIEKHLNTSRFAISLIINDSQIVDSQLIIEGCDNVYLY
jgi:hypothetical protein